MVLSLRSKPLESLSSLRWLWPPGPPPRPSTARVCSACIVVVGFRIVSKDASDELKEHTQLFTVEARCGGHCRNTYPGLHKQLRVSPAPFAETRST